MTEGETERGWIELKEGWRYAHQRRERGERGRRGERERERGREREGERERGREREGERAECSPASAL